MAGSDLSVRAGQRPVTRPGWALAVSPAQAQDPHEKRGIVHLMHVPARWCGDRGLASRVAVSSDGVDVGAAVEGGRCGSPARGGGAPLSAFPGERAEGGVGEVRRALGVGDRQDGAALRDDGPIRVVSPGREPGS